MVRKAGAWFKEKHPGGRRRRILPVFSRLEALPPCPDLSPQCYTETTETMTSFQTRNSDHEIEPIFLQRWSPRAYTGEAMPSEELARIFEAARWAPSSYNSQPWRFLYAHRDTAHWELFLGLLNEFNRSWAERASVLIVALSKSTMRPIGADKDIPSHSHSFDTGAAWAQLALQATAQGWHAHAMVGFDMAKAFAELNVPAGYRVEAAIAIGRQGDKSLLPEPLRQREEPNGRDKVAAFAIEGVFKEG
jgi:nitroreductase